MASSLASVRLRLRPDLSARPASRDLDQITRMGHATCSQIEILTTVSGLKFAEAYSQPNRRRDRWRSPVTLIISREHLEINKRAAGRPKDLADLDNLP